MDNLNSALGTWNGKPAEIWQLLSTTPEEFKGGGVWTVIEGIESPEKIILDITICWLQTSKGNPKNKNKKS